MPASAVRLVLTHLLFVVTPVFWAFISIIMDQIVLPDFSPYWIEILITGMLTLGAFTLCWLLIWLVANPLIPRKRRLRSLAAVSASGVGALLFGVGFGSLTEEEIGIVFGMLAYAVALVISSSLIWRQRPHERAAYLAQVGISQIVCPRCGYNLSQQTSSVCPECGQENTLNEVAAHTARKLVDP